MSALADAHAALEQLHAATEAAEAAATARGNAVLALAAHGYTMAELGELLGVSRQRAHRLVTEARARHDRAWAAETPARRGKPTPLREALRADLRLAQYAQEIRAESVTGGYAAETRGFYGAASEPAAEHVERRIRISDADREARLACAG